MVNYSIIKYIKIMMLLFLLVGILIILFSCCSTLFSDDELTLQRTDYTGNELRTDGYYYVFGPNNNTAIYFLYRNGVILTVGGFLTQNLDSIEKRIIDKDIGSKDHWGVFIVNNNFIQYERWAGSTGFSAGLYKCKGNILNNTTIHFIESYNSRTDNTNSIDEIWYFKQFDNKPDSTNNFIK